MLAHEQHGFATAIEWNLDGAGVVPEVQVFSHDNLPVASGSWVAHTYHSWGRPASHQVCAAGYSNVGEGQRCSNL